MPTVPTYSYDPGLADAVSQARLYAADTNVTPDPVTSAQPAIFADQELTFFLQSSGQDPILSAAMALECVATDKARLAVISSRSSGNTDVSALYRAYADRAARLRSLADPAPAVSSPDQVFSTTSGGGETPGSQDVW